MKNTILIISLTLITSLTVAYYLRARRMKNEEKNNQPEGKKDKGETKTQ
jgi:hypothetical protein